MARGHKDWKKIPRVEFFIRVTVEGLFNYVIRHISIYGNMSHRRTCFPLASSLFTQGLHQVQDDTRNKLISYIFNYSQEKT